MRIWLLFQMPRGMKNLRHFRLKLMDERSRMKEELTKTMASTDLPAEDRSKAKEQMDKLNDIAQKE